MLQTFKKKMAPKKNKKKNAFFFFMQEIKQKGGLNNLEAQEIAGGKWSVSFCTYLWFY